jgi:flagellar biosynthesis/type III secretory pathway protein FliH
LPNKDKKKNISDDKANKQNLAMQKEFKDRIAVLTIAYHNLGVEQEFLKMYHEAVESYRMAADFAERYLGASDNITLNLKNIYEKAKSEINSTVTKITRKNEEREIIR